MRPHALALCLCALAELAGLAGIAGIAAGCHRQPAERRPGGPAGRAAGGGTAPRQAAVEENLACRLLTKDDAEAVLGGAVLDQPVVSVMANIGVVSWRCGYISEAKNPGHNVVILLDNHYQQAADARTAYEHAHVLSQTISGAVPENVDGLGERAYWAGGKVNQLYVLSGVDWLVVSDSFGPGPDQLGPAKAAAAKALAHLNR